MSGPAAIAAAMVLSPFASHPSSAATTTRVEPTRFGAVGEAAASWPARRVCRSLICRLSSRASVCCRSIAAGSSAGSTDSRRTLRRDAVPERVETRERPSAAEELEPGRRP